MKSLRRVMAGIAAGLLAVAAIPNVGEGLRPQSGRALCEAVYGAPSEDYELLTVGQVQRSEHYTLEKDKLVLTLVSATGNNSFRTSVVDAQSSPTPRYITTTSFGEAWYTDAGGGKAAPECVEKGDDKDVVAGHVYEVRYERKGTDYRITYRDYTDDKPFFTYEAKDTNLVAKNVYAYVNCLAGSMRVYKGSPSEVGYKKGDIGEMEAPGHGTKRDKYVTREELDMEIPKDYRPAQKTQKAAREGAYDRFFLKDGIQKVEITMDENNLNYVLQNASSKQYAMAQKVVIGGEEIGYAGLKTKGNFTREHTDGSDSDRFSFSLNFGKYVNKDSGFEKRQNFYGLGKVSFNNFFFDKTMMKEYNALRLMTEMGVPTIQYGLAELTINGENYGVYSMLENFDSSVLKQYYNVEGKALGSFLTKPAHIQPKYAPELDALKDESGKFTSDSIIAGGGLVVNEETKEVSAAGPLVPYAPLWENDSSALQRIAPDLPTVLTWMERLNHLAYGRDTSGKSIDVNSETYVKELEKVVDVDEYLRYFAAHSFLCQMDNMFTWKQNYGLYVDKEGRSLLVPWDYDLAWGCDGDPGTPQAVANYDVDKLYNNIARNQGYTDVVADFYRGDDGNLNVGYPLFQVIYQNDSLRQKFHTYMEDCAKLVLLGGTTSSGVTCEAGRYTKTMDEMYDKVVAAASVPTADHAAYLNMQQPDAAKEGIPALKQIMNLRAVGVYLQTQGIEATVTGFGVKPARLGNDALQGGSMIRGERVAVVDHTGGSGIFAIADFTEEGGGPKLAVTEATESDKRFQAAAKELSADKDSLRVFNLEQGKKASSDYELFLPLAGIFGTAKAKVYSCDPTGKLTELAAEEKGDMTVVKTGDISCIAVYSPEGVKLDTEEAEEQLAGHRAPGAKEAAAPVGSADDAGESTSVSQKVLLWLAPLGVALIALVGLTVFRNRKNR